MAHVGSTSTLLQDKRCVLMSTTAVYADIVTHVGEAIKKPHKGLMESDTEQHDNRADPQDDQDKEALFENIIKCEMKVERRSRRASSRSRLFISILEKMAEVEMSFLERGHTDAVLMEEVKHLEEFVRNRDVMLK